MAFSSVSLFVLLSNYSLTAMTPGLADVIEEFGISATESGYLISFQILTLGLGVSVDAFYRVDFHPHIPC